MGGLDIWKSPPGTMCGKKWIYLNIVNYPSDVKGWFCLYIDFGRRLFYEWFWFAGERVMGYVFDFIATNLWPCLDFWIAFTEKLKVFKLLSVASISDQGMIV